MVKKGLKKDVKVEGIEKRRKDGEKLRAESYALREKLRAVSFALRDL